MGEVEEDGTDGCLILFIFSFFFLIILFFHSFSFFFFLSFVGQGFHIVGFLRISFCPG